MDADIANECLEDAAFQCMQRAFLVERGQVTLGQLSDADEQLAALIDGVRVEGEAGWRCCHAAFGEDPTPELAFVAGVLAAEDSGVRWPLVLDIAAADRQALPGLLSCVGWLARSNLGRVPLEWEAEAQPIRRALGLAAMRRQRTLFGLAPARLDRALADAASSMVHREALGVVGELGLSEFVDALRANLGASSRTTRFWAARSALLLGFAPAAEALFEVSVAPGACRDDALHLALMASPAARAHEMLMHLEGQSDAVRLRVIGSGFVGDPRYVPWLIDRMRDPALARVALDALCRITGADVSIDQLEAMPPDDFEDGPTDDADDDDVDVPEDIALPWPDVERVQAWWMQNRSRFTAGQKRFLGEAVTPGHCVHVLKTGMQRQRVIAAHYRSLLEPGTVLFPTGAPSWRQQKLLLAM